MRGGSGRSSGGGRGGSSRRGGSSSYGYSNNTNTSSSSHGSGGGRGPEVAPPTPIHDDAVVLFQQRIELKNCCRTEYPPPGGLDDRNSAFIGEIHRSRMFGDDPSSRSSETMLLLRLLYYSCPREPNRLPLKAMQTRSIPLFGALEHIEYGGHHRGRRAKECDDDDLHTGLLYMAQLPVLFPGFRFVAKRRFPESSTTSCREWYVLITFSRSQQQQQQPIPFVVKPFCTALVIGQMAMEYLIKVSGARPVTIGSLQQPLPDRFLAAARHRGVTAAATATDADADAQGQGAPLRAAGTGSTHHDGTTSGSSSASSRQPNSSDSSHRSTHGGNYAARLFRFYKKYNPDKASDNAFITETLEKWKNDENKLFAALVKKYGPEPPEPEPEDPAQRLLRFYQHYNPEKATDAFVKSTLEKWAGDEEKLFTVLVNKYGAEPEPLDAAHDDHDHANEENDDGTGIVSDGKEKADEEETEEGEKQRDVSATPTQETPTTAAEATVAEAAAVAAVAPPQPSPPSDAELLPSASQTRHTRRRQGLALASPTMGNDDANHSTNHQKNHPQTLEVNNNRPSRIPIHPALFPFPWGITAGIDGPDVPDEDDGVPEPACVVSDAFWGGQGTHASSSFRYAFEYHVGAADMKEHMSARLNLRPTTGELDPYAERVFRSERRRRKHISATRASAAAAAAAAAAMPPPPRPPSLAPSVTLLPHQVESLAWMLEREQSTSLSVCIPLLFPTPKPWNGSSSSSSTSSTLGMSLKRMNLVR